MANRKVTVEILGDAGSAGRAAREADRDFEKLDNTLTSLGKTSIDIDAGFGRMAKGLAAFGAAGVLAVAGAGRALSGFADAASDAQETASKVAVVFGGAGDQSVVFGQAISKASQDVEKAQQKYGESVAKAEEKVREIRAKSADQAREDAAKIKDAQADAAEATRESSEKKVEAQARYVEAVQSAREKTEDAERRVKEVTVDSTDRIKEARENAADVAASVADKIKEAEERASDAARDASDRVKDAKESAADVAVRSAERIKEAEESAAERAESAAERVADTRERALERQQAAAEKVRELEQELATAQADPKRADDVVRLQKRLTDAREDQAKVATKTAREIEKAEEAQQKAATDSAKAVEKAKRDGTKAVENAQERVVKAEEAQTKSAQSSAKSVEKAKKDGAKAVEDAGERVTKAEEAGRRAVEAATRAATRAREDESRAVATAAKARQNAIEAANKAEADAIDRVEKLRKDAADRAAKARADERKAMAAVGDEKADLDKAEAALHKVQMERRDAETRAVKLSGEEAKKWAAEITKWSETAAVRFGQSRQQAQEAASTFAGFGKAAGLMGGDLVGFSKQLTELASDLGSFHNADPSEVILAMGSALRGEAEPMRRFNVLLDDATLKAKAMEMGIFDGNGALTQQQKILAAHQVILDQTKDAQGNFADTANDLANSQRTLGSLWRDLSSDIGKIVLPAFTAGTKGLAQSIISFRTEFEKDGFNGVVRSAGDQLGRMWDTVRPKLAQFGESAGTWIVENAPTIGKKLLSWSGEFLGWAGDLIKDMAPKLVENTTALFKWISDNRATIGEKLREWTAKFTTWAAELAVDLGATLLKNAPHLLKSMASITIEITKALGMGVLDGLEKVDWIKAGKTILDGLGSFAKGLGSMIVDALKAAWDAAAKLINDKIGVGFLKLPTFSGTNGAPVQGPPAPSPPARGERLSLPGATTRDDTPIVGPVPRPSGITGGITSSGGFVNRKIRGSNKISYHAAGAAIDLNGPENAMGQPISKGSIDPAVARRLAAKYGLTWGGDWKSRPDGMHFEVKGAPKRVTSKTVPVKLGNQVWHVAPEYAGKFQQFLNEAAQSGLIKGTGKTARPKDYQTLLSGGYGGSRGFGRGEDREGGVSGAAARLGVVGDSSIKRMATLQAEAVGDELTPEQIKLRRAVDILRERLVKGNEDVGRAQERAQAMVREAVIDASMRADTEAERAAIALQTLGISSDEVESATREVSTNTRRVEAAIDIMRDRFLEQNYSAEEADRMAREQFQSAMEQSNGDVDAALRSLSISDQQLGDRLERAINGIDLTPNVSAALQTPGFDGAVARFDGAVGRFDDAIGRIGTNGATASPVVVVPPPNGQVTVSTPIPVTGSTYDPRITAAAQAAAAATGASGSVFDPAVTAAALAAEEAARKQRIIDRLRAYMAASGNTDPMVIAGFAAAVSQGQTSWDAIADAYGISKAAQGAVVPATRGGRLLVAGEAGETELVTPEDMLRSIIREESGSGVIVQFGDIVVQGSVTQQEARRTASSLKDEIVAAFKSLGLVRADGVLVAR